MVGGAVNFFGGQGQTNSGELVSNALDVTMNYVFDNVFGGTLIPSLDVTYITKYEFEDFIVAGVTVAPGYDGVGFANTSAGRLLQTVPEYRAGFGLLYRRDRHAVNLMARYIPSVINEDAADFNATTRAQRQHRPELLGRVSGERYYVVEPRPGARGRRHCGVRRHLRGI